MGIIYVIMCTANGKQYVGLTKGSVARRWTEHKSTANAGTRNTKLANAIRKYGPEAFSISVLEQVENNRDLVLREIHWISALNTFVDGYNLTSGGEIGKEWSEESRKKVSIANTGRKRSEEWRRGLQRLRRLVATLPSRLRRCRRLRRAARSHLSLSRKWLRLDARKSTLMACFTTALMQRIRQPESERPQLQRVLSAAIRDMNTLGR